MVYGVSGIGFAGANLVLARVLPETEYALFTLVLAFINLGFALAPAGIDGIVMRQSLDCGPRLLKRVLTTTTLVTLALGAIAEMAYGIPAPLLATFVVSSAAGGAMVVAGAQLQREQRFGLSLGLVQSPNFFLVAAALAVLVTNGRRAWLPLLVSAAGFVSAGAWGWRLLLRERKAKPSGSTRFSWNEALAMAGLNASGLLLVQLDRLLIPQILVLRDLATYGVLAALVGSPFRVLQHGVGYSLLPRLAAAPGVLERRRLVAREARLTGAVVVAASAAVWLIAPPLQNWLLAGKYHLAGSLVAAAIVAGIAKILNAFSKATVTALATRRELSLVNLLGWLSVAVATLAAFLAGRWGLTGVIYAVGLGWLLRALTGLWFVVRHLRLGSSGAAIGTS